MSKPGLSALVLYGGKFRSFILKKCLSAKTFHSYIKVRSAFILNQIPTNDPIVFWRLG